MNNILQICGAILVLLSLLDAIQTTLGSSRRGGLVSFYVGRLLWNILRRMHWFQTSRKLMYGAGLSVVVLTPVLWVVLNWGGWFLIFLFSGDILSSEEARPVKAIDYLYFVGMALSTLGTGDVTADARLWRLLSPVIALIGFFHMSLGISYLTSLVNAATKRRTLARTVSQLGGSLKDMREKFSDASSQRDLTERLRTLLAEMETFGQLYQAYPALRFFHSLEKSHAPSLGFARLLDYLLYLKGEMSRNNKIEIPPTLIDDLLSTLIHVFETTSNDEQQACGEKVECPIPEWIAGTELESVYQDYAKSRRLAYCYVTAEGWSWDQVNKS